MNTAQTDTTHSGAGPVPRRRSHLTVLFVTGLLIMLAAVSLFATWTMYQVILKPYDTLIYPDVYVLGVNVGQLTPEEASVRLSEALSQHDPGMLTLSDGTRTWKVPWSEAGLRLDVEATAQVAFAAGRSDRDLADLLIILNVPGRRHEVSPVYAVDIGELRSALERLAPEVYLAPTEAALRLEGGQLVAVPGQPGRALDVGATLDNIVATVTHLGPDNRFSLKFEVVPPRIADVELPRTRAEEMLNRQVRISAHDWLTGETMTWTLGRETVMTWLRIEQAEDGSPTVRVAEEGIQATLESLAAELGEDRGFDVQKATRQVLDVFEAGGGEVELRVTHSPRTYIVQPGDDLTTIATRFGMPPGLIAEANPDIDLDWLYVGQELTIPPEDVLRPYPPVPGKRIVISIAEQRMQVYENGELLYDWPVSTGVKSSPTYTGEFQVLDKNEKAYASQWDLWMPHFIAVYRAGGDTYNGIHALPILSNGQRLWEGSLGSPASYGCIILGIQEAETLYNWAEIGVPVTIK